MDLFIGIMKECYDWWDKLSEQERYDLMNHWYPDAIKEDTNIDKFFGDMPDREQLEIYQNTIKKEKIDHLKEVKNDG